MRRAGRLYNKECTRREYVSSYSILVEYEWRPPPHSASASGARRPTRRVRVPRGLLGQPRVTTSHGQTHSLWREAHVFKACSIRATHPLCQRRRKQPSALRNLVGWKTLQHDKHIDELQTAAQTTSATITALTARLDCMAEVIQALSHRADKAERTTRQIRDICINLARRQACAREEWTQRLEKQVCDDGVAWH